MDDNAIVELYIYDLTSGVASMMSQTLLGRHIEGIWHTAVVVYGKEYFYGGSGIQSCNPGGTVLRQPTKIENIGETFIPYPVFKDYLRGLAESTFRGANYNLLKHNCNIFSQELCQFLCGTSIPKYILDLPQDILSTPLGASLAPLIESIASSANEGSGNFSYEPQISPREQSPGFDELNSEIEQARLQSIALERSRTAIKEKIAKKEKKKDKKKKKKHLSTSDSESGLNMSETDQLNGASGSEVPPEMLQREASPSLEREELAREAERRRARHPPIVFKDINAAEELENLVRLVDGKLSKEDETSVEELHQYLIEGQGSWSLSEGFLLFVGRILENKNHPLEARVHLLRTLAAAALNDDVILLLHQDRRDHILMNYAQEIDRKAPEEQEGIALFICNLYENINTSEWTLYISEWNYNNTQTSNIRATTKVAVHCLLASSPTLKDIGSAIVYNLACKEVKTVVFDDIAVELTMALLQFFSEKPSEEHLFRTLTALSKFVVVSADIPQLVQMIGPHPKSFKGTSSRCDELIDQISQKVR